MFKNFSVGICGGVLIVLLFSVAGTAVGNVSRSAQSSSHGYATGIPLVTTMRLTPKAAPRARFTPLNPKLKNASGFVADHGVDSALSPDGRTLLVLTSGYNRLKQADGMLIKSASKEYVFVYDVSRGEPRQKQVLKVANTFNGIAWNPNPRKHAFYVAGGVDDNLHTFSLQGGRWRERGRPIALGHEHGLGLANKPVAAGVGVNRRGDRLLVTNFENDSVSLIDLDHRDVKAELDLRPGKLNPARHGQPGGEYPFDVVFNGNHIAYVASQRDREIDVLHVSDNPPFLRVIKRIALQGQPNHMLLNKGGSRLFVASDNSDTVVSIDTSKNRVQERIKTVAPRAVFPNRANFKGASPNNLALSHNGALLFVTDGGTNAVAVIRLAPREQAERGDVDDRDNRGRQVASARSGQGHVDVDDDDKPWRNRVIGLIPTGWYPDAVSVGPHDRMLYVVNAKSPPGANVGHCNTHPYRQLVGRCQQQNQYVWQLEKAGLLSLPMPDTSTLVRLTRQVAYNNHFIAPRQDQHARAMMRFLQRRIHHVIYVVKENRTYDQLLGDLDEGNGDPTLAILGPYSPNHHRWADQFVDLDNFYDSGESSNTGWNWTTAGRTTDYMEKNAPVNYAHRGLTYDAEGDNRNINVGYGSYAARLKANPLTPHDRDLLPGSADVAAPDGSQPGEAGEGYLWNSALRAGLTVRNYGFYGDLVRYAVPGKKAYIPPVHHPFAKDSRQFFPTKPALMALSDPFYRGFDNNYPDFWRFSEWQREFNQFVAHHDLPALSLVRLMHDHFGSFSTAIDGVNTVATQMADNDYAVARLIQRIAHSPYKDDTLIFIIEDDAQNGADHVSAHRSVGYIIGPYVKHHAVVATRYTTVNMLRTIEDVLGIKPLGLNDALARPMADVFNRSETHWTYQAVVPPVLRSTQLPLPSQRAKHPDNSKRRNPCYTHSARDAAYWSRVMRGQNFTVQDHLNTARFNRALWLGLKGAAANYPRARDGDDLRKHRARRLTMFHKADRKRCARLAGMY